MATQEPPAPPERTATLRQSLLGRLRQEPATARELASAFRLRETEVVEHLGHLERSLRHSEERFVMEPAECLACGFVFRERRRLGKPGACPRCRSTRIEPPVFAIENAGSGEREPAAGGAPDAEGDAE
jgi:predicted Zn-ribbon and HTH transcriptional regulator